MNCPFQDVLEQYRGRGFFVKALQKSTLRTTAPVRLQHNSVHHFFCLKFAERSD
jgi:hypothetical protein